MADFRAMRARMHTDGMFTPRPLWHVALFLKARANTSSRRKMSHHNHKTTHHFAPQGATRYIIMTPDHDHKNAHLFLEASGRAPRRLVSSPCFTRARRTVSHGASSFSSFSSSAHTRRARAGGRAAKTVVKRWCERARARARARRRRDDETRRGVVRTTDVDASSSRLPPPRSVFLFSELASLFAAGIGCVIAGRPERGVDGSGSVGLQMLGGGVVCCFLHACPVGGAMFTVWAAGEKMCRSPSPAVLIGVFWQQFALFSHDGCHNSLTAVRKCVQCHMCRGTERNGMEWEQLADGRAQARVM